MLYLTFMLVTLKNLSEKLEAREFEIETGLDFPANFPWISMTMDFHYHGFPKIEISSVLTLKIVKILFVPIH